MSLLRRLERHRLPRVGEYVTILEYGKTLAKGSVIGVDHLYITIAGKGIIDLDTEALRRGLSDGTVEIIRENDGVSY
ncbi:MAG: hypothetical protein H6672_12830 [Anaerolineaceae bacterium]|nr:hypothetical protein [Anaerolineaceae bacterium]